ncbi:hypothetical protein SAMN04489717_0565 [Actinopolymorpha singaporensis]|uniref:Uncharacterized protein n=1 Tax=Actinopolymorpha singaporensis TaxID=117157 RepID=A0A1H1LYE0_9ACTN|nr:hypothetical protein SAMN04489717_0565 [Actinopolymorpha singaporensis]
MPDFVPGSILSGLFQVCRPRGSVRPVSGSLRRLSPARSDRKPGIRRADPRLGRVWEAAFVAVLLVLVLAVGMLGAYVLRNLLRRPRRGPQDTDQRNGS